MLEQPTQTPAAQPRTTDHIATVPRYVDTCPECANEVVDGQGLLGCVDCEWVGRVA